MILIEELVFHDIDKRNHSILQYVNKDRAYNHSCKSEYSISVLWLRLDYMLTLLSLVMPFFDDYVQKALDRFYLFYKCLYLHKKAHEKEVNGSEVKPNVTDMIKKCITNINDNATTD